MSNVLVKNVEGSIDIYISIFFWEEQLRNAEYE